MIETIAGPMVPGAVATSALARSGAQPAFADWLALPGQPPSPDDPKGRQARGEPGSPGQVVVSAAPEPSLEQTVTPVGPEPVREARGAPYGAESVPATAPRVVPASVSPGASPLEPNGIPARASEFIPAPSPEPIAASLLDAGPLSRSRLELVASPWKLVATGLARIRVLGADVAVNLGTGRAINEAAASSVVVGVAVAARRAQGTPAMATGDTPWTASGALSKPETNPARMGDTDRMPSAIRIPTDTSAALPFAVRLLRQLEDRDGNTTLWLRDFQLSDVGAASLVPLLRDAAAASRVVIGRIVVNGRTLWSAAARDGGGRHAG